MKDTRNTKAYIEKLKDIKLSESSRARMEKDLLSYAQFHSVRAGGDSRSIEQVPQRTSLLTRLFNLRLQHMTAALLIALMLTGGTTYAAQGAVPGDFLYPVKVEVTENIQSAIALSNEAEAKLQARLTEERLEEAEELASRGDLDAEASADLQTRIEAHYSEALKRSAEAEAEGDLETAATVRASLEGTFRTYASVLSQVGANEDTDATASLVNDITGYADATARATATAEVSADAKTDVEATLTAAGNMLSDLRTQLDRAQSEISAETHARITAQIEETASVYAQAEAYFRAEAYDRAYASAQEVMRMSNQVKAMITTALRLNIDISTDSLLDINGEASTQEDTSSQTRPAGTTEDDPDWSDTDTSADVETDTSVDTPLLDAEVNTDTSVRSNTGVSL